MGIPQASSLVNTDLAGTYAVILFMGGNSAGQKVQPAQFGDSYIWNIRNRISPKYQRLDHSFRGYGIVNAKHRQFYRRGYWNRNGRGKHG